MNWWWCLFVLNLTYSSYYNKPKVLTLSEFWDIFDFSALSTRCPLSLSHCLIKIGKIKARVKLDWFDGGPGWLIYIFFNYYKEIEFETFQIQSRNWDIILSQQHISVYCIWSHVYNWTSTWCFLASVTSRSFLSVNLSIFSFGRQWALVWTYCKWCSCYDLASVIVRC